MVFFAANYRGLFNGYSRAVSYFNSRSEPWRAPDNFPRACLAPLRTAWDSPVRGKVSVLCDKVDDDDDERDAEVNRMSASSFRRLVRLHPLEWEKSRYLPAAFVPRKRTFSFRVRCATTELNEIADEGEIGTKGRERSSGLFHSLIRERGAPFLAIWIKVNLRSNTKKGRITPDRNYLKWVRPIERVFAWTSVVEMHCSLIFLRPLHSHPSWWWNVFRTFQCAISDK